MDRSGDNSRASGWNRRYIERYFGKDVADKLRQTMTKFWRKDRPTLRSERPEGSRDTYLVRWQFGLAAIAAEAEDPHWAKKLSEAEAELACRYAPLELNGFPSWLETLAIEYPAAVDRILGKELSLSLTDPAFRGGYSIFLQNISYAPPILASIFIPRLREWLREFASSKAEFDSSHFQQNLGQALKILISNGNDADRQFVENISKEQLGLGLESISACVWLSALFQVEPTTAIVVLEEGLNKAAPSKEGLAVELIAKVFNGDRIGGVNLGSIAFTPALLLRLVRLCYRHVRVQDDAHHIGSFTPDLRDDGERARNLILGALLETTGREGWAAKLEMAEDPLFAHFRDRALALAQQKAAEEADNVTYTEADYTVLEATGESPPLTRDDMFALLRDRLDDIEDLLLQDASPRELWATIKAERLLRREIARELKDRSNLCYTVDQEAATADEKETDIRLRSTRSDQQGVIELKLADERPGSDLFQH